MKTQPKLVTSPGPYVHTQFKKPNFDYTEWVPMTASHAHLEVAEYFPRTHDGWSLHLKRTISRDHFNPGLRPLVIIPGYGMNAFILGYHPKGTSMERSFAEAGFEVWSANLRGQGLASPWKKRAAPANMERLATIDVREAVETAIQETETECDRVDLVGCSLGGTLAYAYLSLTENPRVGAVVAMGSPLRWIDKPALLKIAFRSRRLAGAIPFAGARRAASLLLPIAMRLPQLLSIYANTDHIDITHAPQMVNTVEDPQPGVNRDLAQWIRDIDLTIQGVNVTQALGNMKIPLMLVAANRDGIVPVSTALSAEAAWGGDDVTTLQVGDDEDWFAHACMFVSDDVKSLVFDPITSWLAEHQ